MSRIISILDEKGYLIKISLLCTFSYKGRDHVIYRYKDDDRVYAGSVTSNNWCENILHRGRLDEKGRELVRFLLDSCNTDSDKYPLNGEHYSIYEKKTPEGRIVTRISKSNKPRFGFIGRFFSAMLKMLFSFFFSAYFSSFYFAYCRYYPITLFPDLPTSELMDMVMGISCVGCFLLFLLCRTRRSIPNLLLNGALPVSLLSLAVGVSRVVWMRIVFILAMVLSVILLLLPSERDEWGKPFKISLYKLYSAFSVPLLVTSFLVMAGGFSGEFAEDVTLSDIPEPEAVMENYSEVLPMLSYDVWDSLTLDEAEKVLRSISEYECEYVLGIEPVSVEIEDMGNELLHGLYNDDTRSIRINSNYVNSASSREVLTTLLHETRHAWQFRVAEMYDTVKPYLSSENRMLSLIRDGVAFEKSIHDPYKADATYEHYLSTALEKDSRRWAETQIFTEYIEYLSQ